MSYPIIISTKFTLNLKTILLNKELIVYQIIKTIPANGVVAGAEALAHIDDTDTDEPDQPPMCECLYLYTSSYSVCVC